MKYVSVCSGVEAATLAWKPLGWEAIGFAETDEFPSAVLEHHYPDVLNFGDFTKITKKDIGAFDLLVGGTPCQDFSILGKGAGFEGIRGSLTNEYIEFAKRTNPRILVWENVAGVFSEKNILGFSTFLKKLTEIGYGLEWKVLDAWDFGLPQSRPRVFVVGHYGREPTGKLLSFDISRSRDSKTLRKKRLRGRGKNCFGCITTRVDRRDRADLGVYIFDYDRNTVREPTPLECERAQGFPDNYTLINGASKSKRIKAIGNSMCVNVMEWIGKRIEECSLCED